MTNDKTAPTVKTPPPQIVCAFAENHSGPGWANSLIHVIERDANGKLTERWIQPEDHTAEMAYLFKVSAAAHLSMTDAVKNTERKRRKPKAA
jgi:hypothetical protein